MLSRPGLLLEAAVVGGTFSVIAWLVSSNFKSPLVEHFVAGAIMHISLEAMGIHHKFARTLIAWEDSQAPTFKTTNSNNSPLQ